MSTPASTEGSRTMTCCGGQQHAWDSYWSEYQDGEARGAEVDETGGRIKDPGQGVAPGSGAQRRFRRRIARRLGARLDAATLLAVNLAPSIRTYATSEPAAPVQMA